MHFRQYVFFAFAILPCPFLTPKLLTGQSSELAQKGNPQQSVRNGAMQIRVIDSRTRQPVQAAITGAGPKGFTLETGAKGFVEIDLPEGEYQLKVLASGYNTMRTHFRVQARATTGWSAMLDAKVLPKEESPNVLEPLEKPGYTLFHEYVVDSATNLPIHGARVRFVNAGVETRTDDKGHFYLSVPTPSPEYPGGIGTDTLVYEKQGFKTLIIRNFGITDLEMGGNAIGLEKGKGAMNIDGTHPLMKTMK